MRSKLHGLDLICTQDWELSGLELALAMAERMKSDRFSPGYADLLRMRTFFMFFYNPSVRTRQSFECAMTELGGHAQFLEPKTMRLRTSKSAGETVEDAARVMSRYACGIGIRILEDRVSRYGEGNALLREYAEWAEVPVLNMADDRFHPFQGLADVMGLRERLGNLRGKTLLMHWGHGALARSWCSVQENLLISSRLGMNVRLAHPEGYDLDPEVLSMVRENAERTGASFELTHDPEDCYEGVHVVYSRNWMSPEAYRDGEFLRNEEIENALAHRNWICTEEKMNRTENALFLHPMPVDRGHEVTDEVASGSRSIIYDVAENRLHVQKAVMALTMSRSWPEKTLEELGAP
jgi:N-acetylornithine carbamoyltransferase